MLYAVMDNGRLELSVKDLWRKCEEAISVVEWTHSIAVPTPGSYSQELQFKIASSIPPKPLAELDWQAALQTLRNLTHSAAEAYLILNFEGFENLLVRIKE